MSTPYVGEIRMFAGNFPPRSWAFCDGQLLSISDHEALASLLGATYGGDGRTSFGLPDMRGRIPIHHGQGSGLLNRITGEFIGSETVKVTTDTMPAHTHGFNATKDSATGLSPANMVFGAVDQEDDIYVQQYTGTAGEMNENSVGLFGGSQPHNNLMPSLCLNFIIALLGEYPTRN